MAITTAILALAAALLLLCAAGRACKSYTECSPGRRGLFPTPVRCARRAQTHVVMVYGARFTVSVATGITEPHAGLPPTVPRKIAAAGAVAAQRRSLTAARRATSTATAAPAPAAIISMAISALPLRHPAHLARPQVRGRHPPRLAPLLAHSRSARGMVDIVTPPLRRPPSMCLAARRPTA